MEKRRPRGSWPNFKSKAFAVRKLKGKENCENEHRETASFMYNFVQKTNATKKLSWHFTSTLPLNFFTRFSPEDCLFPFSSTVSSYNFRKPRLLILPTTRTSRYLNSFFYHSALLWNSLPSSIQSITKPNHFRQALTSHWREQK